MSGFLISFEGGDACGKSTQLKLFTKFLEENGYDFICSREPGGTQLGEEVREILLHSKQNLSPKTEFLLFSACRNSLIENVVLPALKQNKIVVLDRYYHSSFAYQGYAGNLELKDLKNITDFAISGAKPNLTILLDISYEEAIKRKQKDQNLKNLDRIESKPKSFHEKVRNGYLTLAKQNKNIKVIDAKKPAEDVFNEIKNVFLTNYKKAKK